MVMDVRRLAPVILLVLAAATAACGEPYEEPLPPRDRLHYPIGMAVHPDGRFLYVVNSNFDTRYREELGGTVSVIDLATLQILADNGPFIPSFGGKAALNANATKLYVPTRHSNALAVLDVRGCADDAEGGDEDEECMAGSAIFCEGEQGEMRSDPADCLLTRVPDTDEGGRIPTDPFGLSVETIGEGDGAVDVVNLAHLRGSVISTITLPGQSLESATLRTASLIAGSNAIALNPASGEYYAAGRLTNQIVIFRPYLSEDGEVEAILRRGSISLSNVAQDVDARAMVFDQAGERLYVATRAPSALVVIDVGPSDPETGGGVANEVVDIIPMPEEPSDVVLHETVDGRRLLYVTCFEGETIQVVDPALGVVVDAVELGASPYTFAIDRAGEETNHCTPGGRCRGYVTLFDDTPGPEDDCNESRSASCGSVGVIELDPSSPRYHQLIAKIH